jgi:hypothetical protein
VGVELPDKERSGKLTKLRANKVPGESANSPCAGRAPMNMPHVGISASWKTK